MSGASKPGSSFSTRKPWISPSVGARPDDGDVRDGAVRDPPLRAVEDPVVAVALRRRPHRAGVRAEVRLGQPEAADLLARRASAGASAASAPRSRTSRSGTSTSEPCTETRQRMPGVARLELLADEPVHDRARLRQAVALEVHPEQAEPRELRDQLGGKLALLEPLADVRLDLLRDELAHRVADRALLVGEEGVDREEVERIDLGPLRGRRHSRIVRVQAVSGWTKVSLTD